MKTYAVLLALALAASGCIDRLTGDAGDGDGGALDGPYKVFMAARGAGDRPLVATVDFLRVVTASGATALDVLDEPVNLTKLAASDQALLVAAGAASGAVKRHEVGLKDVRSGASVLAAASTWTVTHAFNVTGAVEVTLTLDLADSVQAGAFSPVADSLVAENANGVVSQASKTQLRGGSAPPPAPVEPLPTPQITIEGPDGSFPSWRVDTELEFSVSVPGFTQDQLADAFWFFDDGNTVPGFQVSHAFHTPGLHNLSVVVHSKGGEAPSTASATIEAWFQATDSGTGLQGDGGLRLSCDNPTVADRDCQTKEVKVPGTLVTRMRVALNFTGAQEAVSPSNVHLRLYGPDGALLGEVVDTSRPKVIEAAGPLRGGTYTVEVAGDQGVSIGYSFVLEAHYL